VTAAGGVAGSMQAAHASRRGGPVRTMRRRSPDQLVWLVLAATAVALCYTGVSLATGGLTDAQPGLRVGPVRRLLKEFTPLEKARDTSTTAWARVCAERASPHAPERDAAPWPCFVLLLRQRRCRPRCGPSAAASTRRNAAKIACTRCAFRNDTRARHSPAAALSAHAAAAP
jgi:hypothetical protein